MYLELTSIPDTVGGPLAFAHVPWQLPVTYAGYLAQDVSETIDTFRCQHGDGFKFRLVLEEARELRLAHEVCRVHGLPYPDPASLAGFLNVDEVVLHDPERRLTDLEIAAASEINRLVADLYSRRVGDPPSGNPIQPGGQRWRWTLHDEQSRRNLARAAEMAGVELVA